jgi:hypothetical protein
VREESVTLKFTIALAIEAFMFGAVQAMSEVKGK